MLNIEYTLTPPRVTYLIYIKGGGDKDRSITAFLQHIALLIIG